MMKRSLLKKTGAILGASFLIGTTAMAATEYDYYFNLSTSEAAYTPVKEKETTSGTAKVTRTEPKTSETSIEVTMYNNGSSPKSDTKTIVGVGTKYPSYSGYNVNDGDFLRLRVYNPSGKNQGHSISAGGTWRP